MCYNDLPRNLISGIAEMEDSDDRLRWQPMEAEKSVPKLWPAYGPRCRLLRQLRPQHGGCPTYHPSNTHCTDATHRCHLPG